MVVLLHGDVRSFPAIFSRGFQCEYFCPKALRAGAFMLSLRFTFSSMWYLCASNFSELLGSALPCQRLNYADTIPYIRYSSFWECSEHSRLSDPGLFLSTLSIFPEIYPCDYASKDRRIFIDSFSRSSASHGDSSYSPSRSTPHAPFQSPLAQHWHRKCKFLLCFDTGICMCKRSWAH